MRGDLYQAFSNIFSLFAPAGAETDSNPEANSAKPDESHPPKLPRPIDHLKEMSTW